MTPQRKILIIVSFTTKLGMFGILFKGSRNLWSNQGSLKNLISKLTLTVGHSEYRHGQWEAKDFSFCDNNSLQSPFCQPLEITKVSSLALKFGASAPALRKGRSVFICCSTLLNSFSIIGMLMSPGKISILETNRVIYYVLFCLFRKAL